MKNFTHLADFIIDIDEDRDIRILQVTDLQPVDSFRQRFPGRLQGLGNIELSKEERYEKMYKLIEDGIKRTSPDLILITGDIVYGEFDDDGYNFKEITTFFENTGIPWAPIFGNHDNESKMGVSWQCKVFESANNCLFKQNTITGNGNYRIGITHNNKLIKIIYMMDSNGSWNAYHYPYLPDYQDYNEKEKVKIIPGFGKDQVKWIDTTSKLIGNKISKFLCMHIVPSEINYYCQHKGYERENVYGMMKNPYTLGVDLPAKDGDFGTKGEGFSYCEQEGLWDVLNSNNFDGLFVGHDHADTLSVLCDKIRITFGLKTSMYDYYTALGSTLITLKNDGSSFKVEHIYYTK